MRLLYQKNFVPLQIFIGDGGSCQESCLLLNTYYMFALWKLS